jgi:phosphocarrier protein
VTVASRRVVVTAEAGLHARVATALAQLVLASAPARLVVLAHGRTADAASVIALMTLDVHRGAAVELRAEGVGATALLDAATIVLSPPPP